MSKSKKELRQLGIDNHVGLALDGDGWKGVCFATVDGGEAKLIINNFTEQSKLDKL